MLVDAKCYWQVFSLWRQVSRGFGMSGDSNPSTLTQSHYPWWSQFSLVESSTQLPSLPASWCELFLLWTELNTCYASYTCVCLCVSQNTRKHPSDPAGYKGTAQHETSSTASHSSSTSTVSSERMRARRVVLFIILVIAAFLVAILVGLLVYFLFMTGAKFSPFSEQTGICSQALPTDLFPSSSFSS